MQDQDDDASDEELDNEDYDDVGPVPPPSPTPPAPAFALLDTGEGTINPEALYRPSSSIRRTSSATKRPLNQQMPSSTVQQQPTQLIEQASRTNNEFYCVSLNPAISPSACSPFSRRKLM